MHDRTHIDIQIICDLTGSLQVFFNLGSALLICYRPRTRRVAINFDSGGANKNQVSTFEYILPLVFKTL